MTPSKSSFALLYIFFLWAPKAIELLPESEVFSPILLSHRKSWFSSSWIKACILKQSSHNISCMTHLNHFMFLFLETALLLKTVFLFSFCWIINNQGSRSSIHLFCVKYLKGYKTYRTNNNSTGSYNRPLLQSSLSSFHHCFFLSLAMLIIACSIILIKSFSRTITVKKLAVLRKHPTVAPLHCNFLISII